MVKQTMKQLFSDWDNKLDELIKSGWIWLVLIGVVFFALYIMGVIFFT